MQFSPAFRWGLIEASDRVSQVLARVGFSPAFRWGLIEARHDSQNRTQSFDVFPGISLGPH